jgi:serine/threonine protein phosphatase PrpC
MLPATEQMVTAMPDISVFPLDSMDFIVIGCDGIWECKTSQEVADFIYKRINTKSLQEIIHELLDECLCTSLTSNMNGYDNMTCIIIQLK